MSKQDIKESLRKFQVESLNNLEDQAIFDNILYGMSLRLSQVRNFVLDAIGILPFTHYLVEVKFINQDALEKSIRQMHDYLNSYGDYLIAGNDFKKNVRGIIIVPDEIEADDFYEDKIAILKYSREEMMFTNLDEVKNWISN